MRDEKLWGILADVRNRTIVPIHPATLTQQLKSLAQELGFTLCGVTPAATPQRLQALHQWLDAGFAGQMEYIENRRAAYEHPRHVLDGCRSVLMLALPYLHRQTAQLPSRIATAAPPELTPKIARYAQSSVDYHDVIHARLKTLRGWLLERLPNSQIRGVVDTAPLLERELAEAAGLGWVGKNTLLLNRRWGSYFFLAALLTDAVLEYDSPDDKGYCGTCTACLTACPTQAFPKPFVLDANKCISYLTIEHRANIDESLSEQLGGWVFGCDVCQEVCPWNRKAERTTDEAMLAREDLLNFDLAAALRLSDTEFRQRFRATALWRSKRRGLLRNALLVAGKTQREEFYPDICRLLADEEPLLRSAAAWALSRFKRADWQPRLTDRLVIETDSDVRVTLQSLLPECG